MDNANLSEAARAALGQTAGAGKQTQPQTPTMEQFQQLLEAFNKLSEKMATVQQLAPDAVAAAETPEEIEGEPKVFYTTIPHSGFHIMTGPGIAKRVHFLGNELVTKDLRVQRFLEAIADKEGSPIYTKTPQEDAAVIAAAMENQANAALTMDKLMKAGLRPE